MIREKYIDSGLPGSYTSERLSSFEKRGRNYNVCRVTAGGCTTHCFIFLLLTVLHTQLFSQLNNLQQLHYTIDVQLDDRQHVLNGFLKLNYKNLSADTLRYIWFQLWPNAFKNDHTAFSEHLLDSGITAFYFSEKEQKGYINRLVFRSGNEVLMQEDHPQYIDIIKVSLIKPLLPGGTTNINTPFHVQLPYDFSGFGHAGQEYHIQNWYPAVALLNESGWQPKPYTGLPAEAVASYDVTVTLPKKYMLETNAAIIDSSAADTLKTLKFHAENINDFVWSAEQPGTTHPALKKTFDERIAEGTSKILRSKILPAAGYNVYDGFQLGIMLHNFQVPEKKLTWYLGPMYAFNSRRTSGFLGVNYNINAGNYFRKISAGFNISKFSSLKGRDSVNHKIFGGFSRITPYVRFTFPSANAHNEDWLELRTYIIGEKDFDYARYSVDSFYYPVESKTTITYLNQLTFKHTSCRVLYPYDAQLQIQQAKNFYRINGEAHYFFNYSTGGGMQARFFAAKFGYIGNGTSSETYRYQPKLTAVRGEEDYTYSNSFIGRNEFSGFTSQQIMMRDGGLKLRTDMFQDLQGRSDN
nr:hypothetical protein [Chitinophagaceae bacterium]